MLQRRWLRPSRDAIRRRLTSKAGRLYETAVAAAAVRTRASTEKTPDYARTLFPHTSGKTHGGGGGGGSSGDGGGTFGKLASPIFLFHFPQPEARPVFWFRGGLTLVASEINVGLRKMSVLFFFFVFNFDPMQKSKIADENY